MWLVSGGNRYGACASLFVAHPHCYIILAIRQYPKVVATIRIADQPEAVDSDWLNDPKKLLSPIFVEGVRWEAASLVA